MKNILIVFALLWGIANAQSNTILPWDSLFEAHGLSDEMKQIPMMISPSMDVKYCHGNCAGLWGLTAPVARYYGLKVDEEIDERYDVKLASEVAARYLEDLIRRYKDERVARLAYLNGAALMVEMAKRLGVDLDSVSNETLDLMCRNLPRSGNCDSLVMGDWSGLDSVYWYTGYVKYKFNYPIRKQTVQDSIFRCAEEFERVNLGVMSETRWVEEVYVPDSVDMESWIARVGEAEREAWKSEQEEVLAQREAEMKARAVAIKKANAVKIYYVKSGDTLSHIAKRHKVSVRQLKQWNNLKSDFLRIGQKLKIHTI